MPHEYVLRVYWYLEGNLTKAPVLNLACLLANKSELKGKDDKYWYLWPSRLCHSWKDILVPIVTSGTVL